MKKRIGLLLLAACMIVMCVAFASCGKTSAYDVVSKAIKNTQKLDSVAMEVTSEIGTKMDGASFSIPITADITATGLTSENPEIYTETATSMWGISMNVKMYQKDGWAYIDDGDSQHKTQDAETISEQDLINSVDLIVQELPEDVLKDVELMENEDGNQMVKLSIPEEKFLDIYGDFAKEIAGEYDAAEADISDVDITIVVENEYVSEYKMAFSMKSTEEDDDTEMTVEFNVTYKNPGEAVTVTPLEGYQEFEEYSEDDFDWDTEDDSDDDGDWDWDLSGDEITME